jgi:hypothetical protein
MLPLLVVGGIIGAVVSAVQGGSWLSDKVDASNNSASVGGKASATPATDTKTSPFAAALAAQVAGQSMPASPAVAPVSSIVPPSQYGTDYDALARMNAGLVAYNHIGEHHGNHTKQPPDVGGAGPVMRS